MSPNDFMREYEAASRAQDLDRTLALIDDEAVYWFSGGDAYAGKAAIASALRANFEAIEGDDYRVHDLAWIEQNERFAVCTYRFTWSGVVRGQAASGAGRGTSVIARRGDGWVVRHEHLSRGPVG